MNNKSEDWITAYAEENLVPLNVSFELTYKCNAKCVHCYVVQDDRREKEELTTAEWIKVMDDLAVSSCLTLTYTGGEAMLRPDFWELARAAIDRNFALQIFTNGILVDENVISRFVELNILGIGVSLYATKAEIHERTTGIPGSFDKAVNAIRLAREAGLNVLIKHVVMRHNKNEFPLILDLADKLGAIAEVDPIIVPANDGSLKPTACRLSDDDLERVLGDKRINPKIIRGPAEKSPGICSTGCISCGINPYGDVIPCLQLLLSAGNVRRQEFVQIWKTSPTLRKIRSMKPADASSCQKCELKQFCCRCPGLALLEDGDLYGPSRIACQQAKIFSKLYAQKN